MLQETHPRLPAVTLVDRFGSLEAQVGRPLELCAPTNKNDEDPTTPTHPNFMICYKLTNIVPPLSPVATFVDNQFGPGTFTVRRAHVLCVPARER